MLSVILKKFFFALFLVFVIDFVWLNLIAKGFYDFQLASLSGSVVVWSALLAWFLISLGVVVFVSPLSKSWKSALYYGALFGFVLYGVYEFTNYAVIADWTLSLLVVDIVWGTFLCGFVSLILFKVRKIVS